MTNVKIGSDGSIIKDDVVVESEERTIIREDGTIESTNVGSHSVNPVRTVTAAPPVSPLDRDENRNVSHHGLDTASPTNTHLQQGGSINLKAIKEKEYDIQMIDGRIKNAIPMNMVVVTIILCILGIMGLSFLFIPAVVTSVLIIGGFMKKSNLESEKAKMCEELQVLKHGDGR